MCDLACRAQHQADVTVYGRSSTADSQALHMLQRMHACILKQCCTTAMEQREEPMLYHTLQHVDLNCQADSMHLQLFYHCLHTVQQLSVPHGHNTHHNKKTVKSKVE